MSHGGNGFMPSESGSSWARVHFNLGEILTTWGWLGGAVWAYYDAINADPGHTDAFFRLGEILLRRRRWEEAAEALREAIRLQPRHVEAHGNLALALYRQGTLGEAATIIERMTRLRPFEAELHLLRGAILRRRGLHGEAIRAFRWAVNLELHPRTSRFYLGEEVLGRPQWESLVESYRDAKTMDQTTSRSTLRAESVQSCSRERRRHVRGARPAAREKPFGARRRSVPGRSLLNRFTALYHFICGKTRLLLGRVIASQRRPHEAIRAFRQAHAALHSRRES
jgi:tetratricopeptide (TPR) repeat protein